MEILFKVTTTIWILSFFVGCSAYYTKWGHTTKTGELVMTTQVYIFTGLWIWSAVINFLVHIWTT
ncbi:hypothetical protein [Klebsiella phage vB_Kpn_ZCKp20p]|uniref:hypothetical protein n=1 Tax=Klebsiella phage vB_Kpn_ZCKp20p TaxID=2981580 RepID=UPI00220BC297|nr:hypothetical protein PRB86_gp73 [Klebsiella phage vB_Kpn_ZCKp20p]UXQ88453.1 hypothetical protein [Klebsiella phage vB_Kpn_ZCKp20p]